jgi:hypothetical protein
MLGDRARDRLRDWLRDWRHDRLRGRFRDWLPVAMVHLATFGLLIVFVGGVLLVAQPWRHGPPGAAPACSWPLRVEGHATAAQTGLIRCYLQAVARHDLGALRGLANPAYRVTGAQLAQTADARAGLATAAVTMSLDDTGVGTVWIDYADGATCGFGIEIVNPQVAGSWRLDIGPAAPGRQGPAPAATPGG